MELRPAQARRTFDCRVDDYRIFCRSKEEAYQRLIFLSEKLFAEGLSLQKSKTRILTGKEFRGECQLLLRARQTEEDNLTEEGKLFQLSIHYDPYSDTRVDDYEHLKEQVSQVDIAGILGRELEKTQIDAAVTKRAISAILALEQGQQAEILSSLLERENLHTLAPVFPRLMTLLRRLYPRLANETQDMVSRALLGLIGADSHIVKVDLNLAYLLQVLRRFHTGQTEALLVDLFKTNTSPLVRREIILAWVAWRHTHFLTDLKPRFRGLSKWERRAFIVASYLLTDEGKHWRSHNSKAFDPGETVVCKWAATRPARDTEVVL